MDNNLDKKASDEENSQIKELANDIEVIRNGDGNINFNRTAEILYNKGWRKQSDIVREIFDEIEYALGNAYSSDEYSDYPMPHYYDYLKDDIAALRKKFEGEQVGQ